MEKAIYSRVEVSLYRIETAPYSLLNLHDLHYPQGIISHVLQGDVITETAGHRFRVGPGSVMVHPPRLPFSEIASEPGVHQWMLFDAGIATTPDISPADLFTCFPLAPVIPLGKRQEGFTMRFEELRACVEQAPTDFRTGALVSLLLSEVIQAWKESGCPRQPEGFGVTAHRFSDLLLFMEQHLTERLTREDLAARVHLHPGYFDRAFNTVCGVPPMKMLQQMRLARALRLLENTDDTLETIAAKTGLGDATRLSRLFRARYGKAPGAARAESRTTTRPYLYGQPEL